MVNNEHQLIQQDFTLIHTTVDGVPVGKHPLVTRLVKGVFNMRPPLPRYSSTWDLQVVLDHIESMGRTSTLSQKILTWKTVFLLAVTHPSRSADLAKLDVKRLRYERSGVTSSRQQWQNSLAQGSLLLNYFFHHSHRTLHCVR